MGNFEGFAIMKGSLKAGRSLYMEGGGNDLCPFSLFFHLLDL